MHLHSFAFLKKRIETWAFQILKKESLFCVIKFYSQVCFSIISDQTRSSPFCILHFDQKEVVSAAPESGPIVLVIRYIQRINTGASKNISTLPKTITATSIKILNPCGEMDLLAVHFCREMTERNES